MFATSLVSVRSSSLMGESVPASDVVSVVTEARAAVQGSSLRGHQQQEGAVLVSTLGTLCLSVTELTQQNLSIVDTSCFSLPFKLASWLFKYAKTFVQVVTMT